MNKNQKKINAPKLTFRRIRRFIGYMGFALPSILLFNTLFLPSTPVQPSISDYYYTNMRDIFVGILCGVGVFLFNYKGEGNTKWWKNDNLLSNIAGVMAFGVALFPTFPRGDTHKIYSLIPLDNAVLTTIHYTCAAVLFICFALLSLCVFTIGQKNECPEDLSRLNENNIYQLCGWTIFACIALIPLLTYFLGEFEYWTLILETIALFAFAISWLIKGRALGDKGKLGRMIYNEINE